MALKTDEAYRRERKGNKGCFETLWVCERKALTDHFVQFPINAEIIDSKYTDDNGDCIEEDNFYPWIAFTDEDGVGGHFIMRYIHGNNKIFAFWLGYCE